MRFKKLRLLLTAFAITACTPARTGVIGNTLTTNIKPSISITGLNSMVVKAHGRLCPDSGRSLALGESTLNFDYAFFTSDSQPDCFAYAAIVRISNENMWKFNRPGRFDETFSAADASFGGFQWSEQLLHSSAEKDWPSAVWEELGGQAHKYWLKKRWVAHLDDSTRVVMEYCEPWPEAIIFLTADAILLAGQSGEALIAFIKRADAAFKVDQKRGDFSKKAVESKPAATRVEVNIPKLVGDVLRIDHN